MNSRSPDNSFFSQSEFENLATGMCERPSLYVTPPTLGGVCSCLEGFNTARGGAPLLGLSEWLILRGAGGPSLHWVGLLERAAFDCTDMLRSEDPSHIRTMGAVLNEFFQYRRTQGITKIFYLYGKWLRRQRWYDGPLKSD